MLWRSGDDVLVQVADGFVLLAPTGAVRARFETRTFSDEDDLWRTEFVVTGHVLFERTTISSPEGERVYGQKVLVSSLREADDEATRALVERALEADAVARRERALDAAEGLAQREAALEDFGLGDALARAQRALAHRVHTWDDQAAAALAQTLISLARSAPSAEVVAAFASACLLACFDTSGPPVPTAPTTPATSALGLRLEQHARDLDEQADGQDAVDARGNAGALWKAAAAMRTAARRLG